MPRWGRTCAARAEKIKCDTFFGIAFCETHCLTANMARSVPGNILIYAMVSFLKVSSVECLNEHFEIVRTPRDVLFR